MLVALYNMPRDSAEVVDARLAPAKTGRSPSSVEDVQRRKVPVFQEFEGCPAAGADVADLVGEAELFNRRGAVAAADDCRRVVLLRGLGNRFRDRAGARLERLLFEHAHRAVPDDRLGAEDL